MKRALCLATAIVALMAACGDDDDDGGDVAATTTTSSSTTTTQTTASDDQATIDDAEATVRAWIAAIGDGDDAAAIALTAPRSLEAFGGPEGFREREVELAEGWGAWHFGPAVEVLTVEITDDLAVVVLHGEIAQEGPPTETWDALPVVATEDGDRVEPFLDLGNVEMDPPGGATVSSSATFDAYVLGNREIRVIVDGEAIHEPEVEGFDGDQQKATVEVSDLAPGLHALTILLTNDDGVMTRTFTYPVER